MRVKLPYSVKSYFELAVAEYEPVLSTYDMESIVLNGIALHPRITVSGVHGDIWVQSVEKCMNPVFLNRDKYICNAVAGFSHEKHGVSLFRDMKRYVAETGDGLRLTADEAVYTQAPGAAIIALYDPPWTHLVTASYSGTQVFEKIYKGKPARACVGYRSFSVVFQDGRSVLIYEGRISEAGFPLEAVAHVNNVILAKSSGWLIWMEPDMPKPTILVKDTGIELVGFHQHLPVFKMHGKLYRLEGGALVDLSIGIPEDTVVTASDMIVADSGDALTVYDVNLKPILNIPKEDVSKCWAIENKIFCCTRGLCGVVEPGETFIYIDSIGNIVKEHHAVKVASETPAIVTYSNVKQRVKPGNTLEVTEENASILNPYLFNIEIHHLLGSTDAFIESPPSSIELDAVAKAYVSTGLHVCGGLSLLELDVKKLKAPSRVKVLVEDAELRPGKHSICINRLPLVIEPVALDTLSQSKKTLSKVNVEIVKVPEPSLEVTVDHADGSSTVRVLSNAEYASAKLICRNGAIELSIPESKIRDCVTPAHIEVELKHKGFVYKHRRDIVLKGLLNYVLNNTYTGLHEYREGGFITRYVIPKIPEINPLSSFKLSVGSSNVDIKFKSKVVGRLVVIAGQSIKGHVVRPGLNTVSAPFADSYYLVFDHGFGKYVYKLEYPVTEQIKIAETHARLLYNALKRWLK